MRSFARVEVGGPAQSRSGRSSGKTLSCRACLTACSQDRRFIAYSPSGADSEALRNPCVGVSSSVRKAVLASSDVSRLRHMVTYLTKQFVQTAQRNSYTVSFGEREITLRASYYRAPGPFGWLAELEVVEGDRILGYITPYGDDEHGAVKASYAGVGAPALFRTLDDALREVLR